MGFIGSTFSALPLVGRMVRSRTLVLVPAPTSVTT